MNDREDRMMRIKRFSQEQVADLHTIEREAGNNWLVAGVQFMTRLDRDLGSFWEPGKSQEERAREVDVFINSPAVRMAFAKIKASPPEVPEIEDVHAADWQVWKYAPMPHTGKGSGESAKKLAAIYSNVERSLPYAD